MINSKVLSRVEALERLRTPKTAPVMNLIFECDDVDELLNQLDYCERHNHPESGLYHSVVWIGKPNATAAELLAGKFGTANRKTIIVKHAEREMQS